MSREPSEWKVLLDRFNVLIQDIALGREGGLRFQSRFVPVSDVAGQYFCEKKVELGRVLGKEETKEMKIGKEAHELLLKDTIVVDREKLWSRIFAEKPTIVREMPLAARYSGVAIIGVADAILFARGYAFLLLEHKFTAKLAPFPSHHVQAQLYCYLIHEMGFNTSMLHYAIVMAPRQAKDSPELQNIVSRILRTRPKEEHISLPLGEHTAEVYLKPFSLERTVAELDWALDFWTMKRDAVPTKKPSKCRTCPYRQQCDSSLVKEA